jgi:ABC-type multidrug transport system permease subunit
VAEEGPRKRKRRRGEDEPAARNGAADGAPANGAANGAKVDRSPRASMERGYARSAERNQEARENLTPLAEGQRPTVVTVAAVICALVTLSIVVGYLAGVKPNGETPKFAQVAAPALIMGVMAWGMWNARYWAVLGFQLILVFLAFASFFGLAVQASTPAQFAGTGGLLIVTSVLFFFMVKAMARIQMPQRLPRE